MTAEELVAEAYRLEITLTRNGDKLRVEAPLGALTNELRQALGDHKTEIMARLRLRGDGQPPPLDRPPATEQEIRRWMDHTDNPENFAQWLDWAMKHTDPAEDRLTC